MDYKEYVASILKMTAPPGEKLQGFDDRILFEDAVKIAEELEEAGKLLLLELEKLK